MRVEKDVRNYRNDDNIEDKNTDDDDDDNVGDGDDDGGGGGGCGWGVGRADSGVHQWVG